MQNYTLTRTRTIQNLCGSVVAAKEEETATKEEATACSSTAETWCSWSTPGWCSAALSGPRSGGCSGADGILDQSRSLLLSANGAAAPVTAATDAVHLAAAWRPRMGLACLRYGEMLRELHIDLSTPE